MREYERLASITLCCPCVQVSGRVVRASPLRACEQLTNEDEVAGTIAIIERGDCMFIEKVSEV